MQEDYRERHFNNEIEKAKCREEFTKKVVEEPSQEERYKDCLSQFYSRSVPSFITHYANLKRSWYEHAEAFSNYHSLICDVLKDKSLRSPHARVVQQA